MDINYLGHSAFKIKGKTVSVVTDPFDSDMIGMKLPKTEADIVTISHNHGDHNNAEVITGVKRIIDAPGEYEINGTSFIGIDSYHDDKKGTERGKNTIFVIEMDGLRICHLGDLGHTLNESTIAEIGDIDVLMVPVGGVYTIDAKGAVDAINAIEPKVIIPMHFKTEDHKGETFDSMSTVEDFLKEIGLRVERLPKLSVKAGELSSEDQHIVVLSQK